MGKKVEKRKDNNNEIEKRSFDFILETRKEDKPKIVGHAAVFNQYADIAWWKERILPEAFKNTIKKDDIRALFNHDPNHILGRNKNKTLSLREDEKGLYVEIMPPDTQFANDLMKLIERGDISQMSFAFRVLVDEWDEKDEKNIKRDIKEVKLFDVSPVTYPAFIETDVSLRSYKAWKEQSKNLSNKAWREKLLLKQLNLKKRM